MPQLIDTFASKLPDQTRVTVQDGASAGVDMRAKALSDFSNVDELRRLAGAIKQHTLDHLDQYLEQAVEQMEANGVTVHFASETDDARDTILNILRSKNATRIVKTKSMATEEVHLNAHLEKHGIECVETDLGEFIVQLDEDTPSHIIKPIIHKNRHQIAETFQQHGLGDYNTDPETITRRARTHLRSRYMQCDAGITGANFISAESGRIVIVTNEGNARFCLAPAKVHIALVGIEKIVPRDRDLGLFLNLLGRSATGQQLTVYTEFISGPKLQTQPHGPEEMHVILLDGGRSRTLGTDCREILRCIRCGACQNVCPVYRQASGHAYRHVYGGPVGAVLSPLLAGEKFADFADLPKASSLCGACNEVCPVDIPIPDLLLKLRNKAHNEGIASPGSLPMQPFAKMATHPTLWRAAMRAGAISNLVPDSIKSPIPGLGTWLAQRTLPQWRGGKFRKWMQQRTSNRSKEKGGNKHE